MINLYKLDCDEISKSEEIIDDLHGPHVQNSKKTISKTSSPLLYKHLNMK